MSIEFEELDYQCTPLGAISLRRRSEPMAGGAVVYEIKLGDEFLMSSLFTEAERRLAALALAAVDEAELDVVVGGLGLGYTAVAALESAAIRSVTVIELLQPVIDWHRRGLVPNAARLVEDRRCSLVRGDFFELAARPRAGFGSGPAPHAVHAVLLDIDHSPSHWLDAGNRGFYTPEGLHNLAAKLHAGGVFGLWSNEPADDAFTRLLGAVFETVEPHVVAFPNPYTGGESYSTIYLARKARDAP